MDLKEQSGNPHRHPWELARADAALRLLASHPRGTRYADVGSGDLYFARRLRGLTDETVYAVDINYTRAGAEDGVSVCTSLDQIPSGAVDCAILMDVLEHVRDDLELLRGVQRVLTAHGELLITVPAHAYLWSPHDEFLGHFRRYDRRSLIDVVQRGGFTVLESFHFFVIPYLARLAGVATAKLRTRHDNAAAVGRWPFSSGHPLTRALRLMLNGDFRISRTLGAGPYWTYGLSIAVRCRRTSA